MKKQYVLHCHHDTLFEELTEPLEKRIEYIKENKPRKERKTRLRLMRILTDEEVVTIPREAWEYWEEGKTWEEWEEEWKKVLKAQEEGKTWKKAWEAQEAYQEAYQEAIEEWKKIQASPAMMEWHKKVCISSCNWDGKTLFPDDDI